MGMRECFIIYENKMNNLLSIKVILFIKGSEPFLPLTLIVYCPHQMNVHLKIYMYLNLKRQPNYHEHVYTKITTVEGGAGTCIW